MKKIKKPIIIIGLVLVVGVGGYFAYNRFMPKNNPDAMAAFSAGQSPMTIEIVSKGSVKDIITATGTVKLEDEQSIYADGEAKVKEVKVAVGDSVKAGQVLVIYDAENSKDELLTKIREAEISYENQSLTLKTMTIPISESEEKQLQTGIESAEKSVFDAEKSIYDSKANLASTESKIEQKKADIEKAEKNLKINTQLYEAGAITKEEVTKTEDALKSEKTALEDLQRQIEQNEMNIKSAENNLKISKSNLESAKDKLTTSKEVLKNEADQIKYKQQQNQLSLTQFNLDTLREKLSKVMDNAVSPLDGTVTEVKVERGTKVNDDSIIIKVADFSKLIVKADISEYDVPKLALGQRVTMTTDGMPNKVYDGKIIKIDDFAQSINTGNGTDTVVQVEISVENVDDKIKPGFSFDCEVMAVDKQDCINIPIAAVLKDYETKENYVFVVEEGALRKKTVQLGMYGSSNVEVTSGINEGDKVITSPNETMHDGMPFMTPGEGFQGGEGGGKMPGGAPGTVRVGTGGGNVTRVRVGGGSGGR